MADKVNNIKTNFSVSGEQQYKDAVKGIAKEQSLLSSEVKKYNKQLKNLGNSQADQEKKTEILKKKSEALAKQYNLQKERITQLNGALKAAKEHYGENSDEVQSYQKQIHTAEGYLSSFEQELKNATEELGKQESKLHRLAKSAGDFGEKMSKSGEKLTKGVTVPLTAMAAGSMAAWQEVDEALDGIATATGATGDELEGLQNTFKEVFGSMPIDAAQASDAIGELNTQFGLTGSELEAASKSALMFAEINGADVKSSVQGAKGVIEAFGLSVSDLDTVLDSVNVTGQNTGVSVSKLFDTVKNNAGVLKDLNFSFEEAVNLVGQMEQAGLNSSKALSYMSRAAVTLGKDGKNLKTELAALSKAIENGADKTIIMNKASELFGTKGATYMIDALERGALDFGALADAAETAAGSVSETFAQTLDPMDVWKTTLNNLKTAGYELGAEIQISLTPIIVGLTDTVKDVTEWFTSLDDSTRQTIITVGGLAAALGPALTIGGKVLGGFKKGVEWAEKLKDSLGEKGLSGVIGSKKNGLIGLGLILAAVIGKKLYDAATSLTPEVQKLNKEIKETDETLDRTIRGYEENATGAQGLTEQIFKLASAENKTTAQKRALVNMVDELNKMVPDLNLAYNEQTDSLNKTESATRKLIEAKRAEAEASANMDALTEKYKQRALLLEEQAKLEASIAERRAKGEKAFIWNGLAEEGRSLNTVKENLSKLNSEIEFSESYIEGLNSKTGELNTTMVETGEAISDANKAISDTASSAEELRASQDAVIESYRSQGEAYANFTDEAILKIEEFKEANSLAYAELSKEEQAFFEAKIASTQNIQDLTFESLQEMYEAQLAAQKQREESYIQHLDTMSGATIQQNEKTLEDLTVSWETNQATYQAYYANRLALQQRLQAEEYDGFREWIFSLGVENTTALDDMVHMTDAQLQEYAASYQRNMAQAAIYADQETMAAVNAISLQLQAGGVTVGEGAAALNMAIINAFTDLGADLDLKTQEGMAALAAAIASNAGVPEEEAKKLSANIAEILGQVEIDAEDTGDKVPVGLQRGMFDGQGDVGSAATGLKDETIKGLDPKDEAKAQGEKTVNDLTGALEKGKQPVNQAAQSVGQSMVEGVKTGSNADGGAAGISQNFGQTIINTLSSYEGEAYNAGSRLGSAASRGFADSLQIHSPSRVAQDQANNYAGTLIKTFDRAGDAMEASTGRLADRAAQPFSNMSGIKPSGADHKSGGTAGDNIVVNIGSLPSGMTANEGKALGKTIAEQIQKERRARGASRLA